MPRRVTLVIASLTVGGAERSVAGLAQGLADNGLEVTVVTLDQRPDHYPLQPPIKRVAVDFFWPSKGIWRRAVDQAARLLRLRRALLATRPDVVIAFTDKTNVRVLTALAGTGIAVMVSERSNPGRLTYGTAWEWLRRHLYPHAARVVVQTDAVARWAQSHWRLDNLTVIANGVHQQSQPSGVESLPAGQPRTVIAVGRLVPEKGFDKLIRAWGQTSPGPGWRLLIVGDGAEREHLATLAADNPTIEFAGQLADPSILLAQAHLFVLSSDYEGFPNAMLEAMAAGLPVVSFDCDFGPREIVSPGIDGVLVAPGDVAALAAAMGQLMADDARRERMAARAREAGVRFGMDKTTERWLTEIRAVCND